MSNPQKNVGKQSKIHEKPDIRTVVVSHIKPSDYNPRKITDSAYEGLKNSLQKFGLVDLLVVNKRNMRIISGHQRYKILKDAGVKTVKAIMVDVDRLQEREMNITLNSPKIAGEWTADIIAMLEEIRKTDYASYLELMMKELRDDVSDLELENTGAGKTLPDDIPKVPKKALTKKGDLWILGEHRLLCGDSTNEDDVERLMAGYKATLFATDPPYCVDYTGAGRPTGGKNWSDVYHEVDIPDAQAFMENFYKAGIKHIKPHTALYLWHASKRRSMVENVANKLNILVHQQIIWVKPCAVLTYSFYSWRHEPCLLMWMRGKKPPYKPKNKSVGSVWPVSFLRTGDPSKPEYHTDVWELDWEGKKRNIGLEHPTVKPTEVFAIPMRVHTHPGDVCYEPFLGSGSQVIAAERLNRRCFALEIEPVFCDVAIKRWEEFTGSKAKLAK